MARHRKWEKDRPPLDADFFRRAKKAGREPNLIRRVATYANSMSHVDPFESKAATSLEHYLGLLYFRLLQRPSAADKRAYFDLLQLYNRELLSTTNWLVGRRRGPIETLIRHELSGRHELTIVTFNHDLLVENALMGLPKRTYGRQFCVQHSYGFEDANMISWGNEPQWDVCDGTHGTVTSICKLHGSLNWVFQTRDRTPSLNLATAKQKAIYVVLLRKPFRDLTVSAPGKGRVIWYLWPVVVPPIYEKQGFIQTHLQPAWDRATNALSEAERVIFFGYSFPSADHHARFFFEGLANANPNLKRPVVINPDFGVAQTAWEVLGAEAVLSYRSLDEYLHGPTKPRA